jgi:hypothetical protein
MRAIDFGTGLIHRAIPKTPEAVQALVMRAGIVVKVTPEIAVSLTRLSAIATRRKSMFGAPKSSWRNTANTLDHPNASVVVRANSAPLTANGYQRRPHQ